MKFTRSDDLKTVKLVEKYGLDWSQIAVHFAKYSPGKIKNRYYFYIKKKKLQEKYVEELKRIEVFKKCIEA